MGSKGSTSFPQTQFQSSTYSPNPFAMGAYQDLLSRAGELSKQPYQAYGGQLVQGFSPDQLAAFQQVRDLQGVAQPYIDQARQLATYAATAGDPQHFSQETIDKYYSPFHNDVVRSTLANLQESNAGQQNQIVGNAVLKGAFGGDRVGVAQSELARQQGLATGQTIADLQNLGYQTALGQFNQSLDNAERGARTLGGLGQEALTTGLAGADARLQAGGLQQQLGQARLSTDYQQWLNQQAFPYRNLAFLSGIVNNTGPNMGGTTNSFGYGNKQEPGPNSGNSIFGGLLSLASLIPYGAFFKDGGRVEKGLGGGLGGFSLYDGGEGGGIIPDSSIMQVAPHAPIVPQPPGLSNPTQGGRAASSGLQFPKISDSDRDKIRSGLGNLVSKFNNSPGQPIQLPGAELASAQGVGDVAPVVDFGGFGGLYAHGGGVRRGFAAGGDIDDVPLVDMSPDEYARRDVSRENVDPTFARMIQRESGGKQFDASGRPLTSPKGATGLAQIMPGTAPEAAGLAGLPFDDDRYRNDPSYNLALGRAYYQKQLKDFGSPELAAAAYNAGPGRLAQALGRVDKDGGSYLDYLPSETRAYVANVTGGGGAAPRLPAGALTYDDVRRPPPAPAIAAIDGAAKSSGFAGAAPTASEPGAAPTPSGFGSVLKFLDAPETRQAILAAGLGMMASRSPYLGQAIGEGGLAGLGAYQNSQTAKAQIDLKRQELDRQLAAARATAQKPVNVSSGSSLVDPITGKAIYTAPEADKNKYGVIGEDQYGRKIYGYPPKPGEPPPVGAANSAATQEKDGQDALNLHGEDFIETLDGKTQGQVRAIIEGRAPYPTGMLLKTPYGQKLAAMVTQADPTFDVGNAMARVKVRNEFNSGGPNSPAGAITAGNTAIQHLGQLSDQAEAIGNAGSGIPGNNLYNTVKNTLAVSAGAGEHVVRFNNALDRFTEEATKFYRGIGGNEADIKRAIESLNPNQSPLQLRAAIQTQAELMASKINVLQDRWKQGMGPLVGDFPILHDKSKSVMDTINQRAAPAPSKSEGPQGQSGALKPPPPADAVAHLKANPELKQFFDQKYGSGAADRILGVQ